MGEREQRPGSPPAAKFTWLPAARLGRRRPKARGQGGKLVREGPLVDQRGRLGDGTATSYSRGCSRGASQAARGAGRGEASGLWPSLLPTPSSPRSPPGPARSSPSRQTLLPDRSGRVCHPGRSWGGEEAGRRRVSSSRSHEAGRGRRRGQGGGRALSRLPVAAGRFRRTPGAAARGRGLRGACRPGWTLPRPPCS